ncbi:MAG: nucleotide exchange factor GrpE [Candidatus Aenigmatarchaeota archaeon]
MPNSDINQKLSKTTEKLSKEQLKKKIENLQKDLEEKTRLAEESLNQIKYLQADFDNYRKSLEKEKEKIREFANESLIKELLIILDDFESALHFVENEKSKEGLNMLYRKFFKILEDHGLKKIEALGKKFDPYYHEAILKERSDKDDGIILEEIQPGYMLKSKVIRHSKVKVAENKPSKSDEDKNHKEKLENEIKNDS